MVNEIIFLVSDNVNELLNNEADVKILYKQPFEHINFRLLSNKDIYIVGTGEELKELRLYIESL